MVGQTALISFKTKQSEAKNVHSSGTQREKKAFIEKCQEHWEGMKWEGRGGKNWHLAFCSHAESKGIIHNWERQWGKMRKSHASPQIWTACIQKVAINYTKLLGCKATAKSSQVQRGVGELRAFPISMPHPSSALGKNPLPFPIRQHPPSYTCSLEVTGATTLSRGHFRKIVTEFPGWKWLKSHSMAASHSLDFGFKRRCVKEKNSTDVFLGHRKFL